MPAGTCVEMESRFKNYISILNITAKSHEDSENEQYTLCLVKEITSLLSVFALLLVKKP
jgi:hypothetical protein